MIERFVDDDRAFQSWPLRHWHGFVVNCNRNPVPMYLMLHIADCSSLTRHENYTTKDYIKVYAD